MCFLPRPGLVLKSFANARSMSLGFEPGDLLTARIDLPDPTYPRRQNDHAVSHDALVEKIKSIPGVDMLGSSPTNPPLMTGWQTGFYAEGTAGTAARTIARPQR